MIGTQTPEYTALAALPGFETLAPDAKRQMARLCAVEVLAAEQVVFRYGDPGDALFVVAAGAVEVFTHNNAGQEIVLETVGAGAALGEVALFSGDTRTANAKAAEATTLLRIARAQVPAALALCPGLTNMLLTDMARRLRTSGDKLRHLTTFDLNAMKREQLTPFDKLCEGVVSVLAGVPFLVAMTAGCAWWIAARPFHDSQLDFLSLWVGLLGLLVTLLVLLNQRREEKSAAVADAEESLAIRQAVKELQYLHEKLDAALSRKG